MASATDKAMSKFNRKARHAGVCNSWQVARSYKPLINDFLLEIWFAERIHKVGDLPASPVIRIQWLVDLLRTEKESHNWIMIFKVKAAILKEVGRARASKRLFPKRAAGTGQHLGGGVGSGSEYRPLSLAAE